MSDNPATILVDISGSQVGACHNPIWVTGAIMPPINASPTINVTNNIFNGPSAVADPKAIYVLASGSNPEDLCTNARFHQTLRDLVHLSNDDGPRGNFWPLGMYKETEASPFPTYQIWWEDTTRTKKIVDTVITRNSMQLPTTIQWRAYAVDGITIVDSYTDNIIYSGIFEVSRSRSYP